jgi:glycosyltransferase involved in cell wall biosynthesis
MKLTAIIPTFNEEHHIKEVIESVLFADEIMIVDSYSTDNTLEIAKQYTDFIIQRDYEYSASQKNWAIPQASNEWILLVDADERVTPKLQEEIKAILKTNPKESGFWIYRENYFMGKLMKHSGLNTDKVIRLFKRDLCEYEDKHVHSEIITQGEVGFLKHKLVHNTYVTLDKHLEKKNRYAWWSAKDHLKKNHTVNPFYVFIKPSWRFIKHYIIQLGFLDGIPGLAYAYIESYGVFTRYLKIWLLRRGIDEEKVTKPKFLLYTSYVYGLPILKPLEKILKNRNFEIAWYIEQESAKKQLPVDDLILHSKEEVLTYSPSIILAAANEVPHFFPGMKVQVFHGFNVSKRSDNKGHFRIRGLFDLYCTQGPSTTLPFKELEKKHQHFKVIETGWSKMDLLFPLSKNNNKKPVVLFASTFTKSLSIAYDAEVFDTIQKLIKKNKYDWIITLHPKMDPKIVKKFKVLASDYNIPYIDGANNLEHLKKADVLLTDTSSIITEFIIQQKPVITYKNRKPQAHLLNVINANEIEKNIDIALSKPENLMKSINDFAKKEHPYYDGKSSERIINATLDFFYSKQYLNLKSKPFNWIRKYKINRRIK